MRLRTILSVLATASLPLLMGAQGDGCAASSRSPAPDVTGRWDVTYDDALGVEVRIGGAVYTSELGPQGGSFTIEHEGHPLTFDLDCARPEVLCPSEAWPASVIAEQRDERFEHRMIVTLPVQQCDGTLREPSAGECGEGTSNPDCDQICEGEVSVRAVETFGVIGESGQTFRLYLGGGIATNGVNCVLLGGSVADANLDTIGSAAGGDWEAIGMSQGLVTTSYGGGCLWAGDPDADGDLDALVLGASVTFTTGFTAAKN